MYIVYFAGIKNKWLYEGDVHSEKYVVIDVILAVIFNDTV
jgi:hypothetical protein